MHSNTNTITAKVRVPRTPTKVAKVTSFKMTPRVQEAVELVESFLEEFDILADAYAFDLSPEEFRTLLDNGLDFVHAYEESFLRTLDGYEDACPWIEEEDGSLWDVVSNRSRQLEEGFALCALTE